MPANVRRVSSPSFLGGLWDWGSSLVFWFLKWNIRLISAWPATEGTDACLGALAVAAHIPACVG